MELEDNLDVAARPNPEEIWGIGADELAGLGRELLEESISRQFSPEPALGESPSHAEAEAALASALPWEPTPLAELWETLRTEVLGRSMNVGHPRFMAFVPGPAHPVSALGDLAAAAWNLHAGTWLRAAGPTQVELVVLDWLRQLLGLPAGTSGIFLPGGSIANMAALAIARDRCEGWREGVVYASDQAHSSIAGACHLLGLSPSQLNVVESDAAFRMDLGRLRAALAANGKRPAIAIVANAGSTNTAAVDPLPDLADISQEHRSWLHVDAAYGGAAVLSERAAVLLEGLGRADSVTVDPHKWWFQSYESSVLLCRPEHLEATFAARPEYLAAIDGECAGPNMADRGPQLTRSARALKFWLALKASGLQAFSAAVSQGIHLAEQAEAMLADMAAWEVLSPAQLGVVTFALSPADGLDADAATEAAAGAVNGGGFAYLGTTTLKGRKAIRLCTINPATTPGDIAAILARLDQAQAEIRRRGAGKAPTGRSRPHSPAAKQPPSSSPARSTRLGT